MKIEHVAWMHEKPAEVAAWYVRHLGFRIVRSSDKSPFAHFMADSGGKMMVEIYNNPASTVPDYPAMHPLQLHLAFVSDDPKKDRDRLVAAGATLFTDLTVTGDGDELVMLRDPWGFPIQLCKRARPMV